MITFIYVVIVLIATTLGSAIGLGGGVIIKPLFDLIGAADTATISLYSSMAVFTMSVVSIYKQYKNKAKFELPIVITLAIGSILGGIVGDELFFRVYSHVGEIIKVIQNGCLAVVLLLVLLYTLNREKIKTHKLKNPIIIFLIGFLLGNISVFLGIGGGPLNLAILSFFFSYTTKESVVLSLVIIFFSQLSKLITTFVKNSFLPYDLSVVPYILVAAIVGGLIGSVIYKKLTHKQLDLMYVGTVGFLILLSIYNMISTLVL